MKRTPETIEKQQMHKGVLFYVCYNNYNGSKYYVPTDDELKDLLSVTDEFLFIPLVTYNRYTDSNGVEHQVITEDFVEKNLSVDKVGSPDRYEIIKSEYLATAKARYEANYHINDYIADSVALAKRLIAINPDVRLWFSVPSSECLHALTDLFSDLWIALVDQLKSTLGEIWDKNVQGIYYSNEDVVTAGYTKFDPSIPERNFNNPIVESMRKVSDVVHGYGKNMLWIPYYHEAASSSTNLGYVVNLTDIFDTVIIQPSFFFNSARVDEIEIVSNCVERQEVVDINGNVIGGKKISQTCIGFEMEIDWQFFEDKEAVERYYAYEKGFGKFVGKYPTAYYAGCPDTMIKLNDLISKFFNSDK